VRRPFPWPAGYGSLTHLERVSLEGEYPKKKAPDFAKALAVASALNDRRWSEPYVAEEWREEAKKELDEMTAREGGEEGEDAASSVYSNDGEDNGVRAVLEAVEEEKEEGGASSSVEMDEAPVWPRGVVGLV
jgi:hypothetical protein